MYISNDILEQCPGVVSILSSDSRLKKALVYYMAEMKLQEFENAGFVVEADEDIVTMVNLIRKGMIRGVNGKLASSVTGKPRKKTSGKAGRAGEEKKKPDLPILNKEEMEEVTHAVAQPAVSSTKGEKKAKKTKKKAAKKKK